MKAALFIILAVILLVGVSGCISHKTDSTKTTAPPVYSGVVMLTKNALSLGDGFTAIQEGNPKNIVIGFLGYPAEKDQANSTEYWYYKSGNNTLKVGFNSRGNVTSKELY